MSKETFWTAPRPDGRWQFGLGWYLLLLIPFFGGLWWFAWRGETARTEVRGQGVKATRIAEAVRQTKPVEEPKAESTMKSERDLADVKDAAQTQSPAQSSPPVESPLSLSSSTRAPAHGEDSHGANALDLAITEAQNAVDRDRPTISDGPTIPGVVKVKDEASPDVGPSDDNIQGAPGFRGGLSRLGETPDSSSGVHHTSDSSQSGPPQETIDSLIVYRRKPDAPPATKPPTEAQPQANKWTQGKFLPRGHIIPLYLLDTIRTDSVQPIITFAVQRDVKFQGRVVIPFGTKVLMTVSGAPTLGQRVVATPSSFQFLDGSEVSVAGVVKTDDSVTGLESYYIPPPTWVQLSGYVNDFLSGYLSLIYAKQQQLSSIKIGGVAIGTQADTFDPKLEAISATSTVIRDYAKSQMTELQARYAPYMYVPAGVSCYMQLTSPVTVVDSGVNVAPLPKVEEQKKETATSAIEDAINTAKHYGAEAAQAARQAAGGL